MKFYLASSFKNIIVVQLVANYLRELGHEITTEWWHTDFKQSIQKPDAEWYIDERVQAIAKRNFDGIKKADAIILIANLEPCKFNGANIELGYALALGKICYSIGKLERSAMYVPVKQFETIEALASSLNRNKEMQNK
jgi:nucleoside 2-deoxyribosyltransferase